MAASASIAGAAGAPTLKTIPWAMSSRFGAPAACEMEAEATPGGVASAVGLYGIQLLTFSSIIVIIVRHLEIAPCMSTERMLAVSRDDC